MVTTWAVYGLAAAAGAAALRWLQVRLRLSRAKHPSLAGHAKMSRRIAKLVPYYAYDADTFFASDGAPEGVAMRRRAAFERLGRELRERSPRSVAAGEELESGVSDVQFTNHYRVPFQYREIVRRTLKLGAVVE